MPSIGGFRLKMFLQVSENNLSQNCFHLPAKTSHQDVKHRSLGCELGAAILVYVCYGKSRVCRTRIAPTILEHTRIVGAILPLAVYQNCSFQQFWCVPELDNSGAYQN